MDYPQCVAERVTQLRMQKEVSARDMSLSLGQSESYINKIENQRALPSMTGFFKICDYLGVGPRDFFDEQMTAPAASAEIICMLGKLTPAQADHILLLIRDLAGE